MIDSNTCRQMALAFPESSEEPHFEKTSFRIKKKIFATLDETTGLACLKLSLNDQDLFSVFDKTIIYPVPNKWGQQGWTLVDLAKVNLEVFSQALKAAYCEVAPKKLALLVKEIPES